MVERFLAVLLAAVMAAVPTVALAGGAPVVATPAPVACGPGGCVTSAPAPAPCGPVGMHRGYGPRSAYWGDAPFPGICGGIVALPFLVVGSLLAGNSPAALAGPPAVAPYSYSMRPPYVARPISIPNVPAYAMETPLPASTSVATSGFSGFSALLESITGDSNFIY